MSEGKIFGLTEEQVKKQLNSKQVDVDPESRFSPLRQRKAIDTCIDGGKKILNDHQTREMLKHIYRGK